MWLRKIITHIIFPPILPCSFRAGKSMFQLQRILAFGWEGLLHILLPRTCFACGVDLPFRFPHPLCAGCLAQIRRPGPLICMRCGTVLPAGAAAEAKVNNLNAASSVPPVCLARKHRRLFMRLNTKATAFCRSI